MTKVLSNRWTKRAVFLVCLIPAGLLLWRYQHHQLGVNWIEKAQHITGDWILRFLIFTLCVTPLRRLPGLNALILYRRMLGLFAFFYASIHFFVIYLYFDKGLDWREIRGDFFTRRFYFFGLLAFVAMVPLAITSTRGWIRRLGRRWQLLHRLIYVSAASGALHYYLQGKSLVWRSVYYAGVVVLLLAYRVAARLLDARRKRGKARIEKAEALSRTS
jgi:methionine sulfoxide reductase heme-binding subunit